MISRKIEGAGADHSGRGFDNSGKLRQYDPREDGSEKEIADAY